MKKPHRNNRSSPDYVPMKTDLPWQVIKLTPSVEDELVTYFACYMADYEDNPIELENWFCPIPEQEARELWEIKKRFQIELIELEVENQRLKEEIKKTKSAFNRLCKKV